MQRVFMIHGYGGFPEEGWRPWLKRELEKRGMEVHVPAMPDTHHPRVDAWVMKMQAEVGHPDKDCIFIGHSLGCIAILRYLESLPKDERVGKIFLLAGFYEDLGERYSKIRNFTEKPVDWTSVLSHGAAFHVIHSDDDPAVPLSFAQRLADHLHVPLQLLHGFKHFSGDNGITRVPFILELLPDAK